MNHHRYHAHAAPRRSDPQGSLSRHVGRSPSPPDVIERLVREARAAGVIVFLRSELERMPDMARAMIESEHKRICERR